MISLWTLKTENVCIMHNTMYEKEGKKNERQLLTVDLLAHVSMKNAASCDMSCRHSAEGLQPHWTRRASAATPPMSSPTWMMSLSCCGTSQLKTRDCWAPLTSTVGIMWECLTDIARGQAHSAYPGPKNWFNKRSCVWTIPRDELSSSRFMTSWSWRKTPATRASSWCISAASAHHSCMKSFLRHFTAV